MHMEFEARNLAGGGGVTEISSGRKRAGDDVNAKIKQFFKKRTEIKPFYSGGKIAVLSPYQFASQCGSGVNVISTLSTVNVKKEPSEDGNGIIDAVDENGDETDEKRSMECFQILSNLEIELDEIITFDACPSTQLLVTSHKSSLLRIWDVSKNEVIKTVKSLHNLPIGIIEIHKMRTNKILESKLKPIEKASSSSDTEDLTQVLSYEEATISTRNDIIWATISGAIVKVWELGGNKVSKAIHIENVASIGYAKWEDSDSKRLFVAERNIYVIESQIGQGSQEMQYKITQTLEGHYSQVTGIEITSDGLLLISGGRDKVLILWKKEDKKNGTFQRFKTIPMPESVESLTLMTPDDLYLVLNPHDIRYYNVSKNALSKASVMKENLDESITGLYSPLKSLKDLSRDFFLITTHGNAIFQMEPKRKEKLEVTKEFVGCMDEVLCVVFWSSAEEIVIANNTNVIKVYDLPTGRCKFLRGHKDIVLALETKNDNLVSGSKDNVVMIWKKGVDQPHAILEGHLGSVTAVCFSPISFLIFSVSEDNFLKLWNPDATSSKCLKSQLVHDKEIHSVNCSPNGQLVITSSRDKTAKIWDAETLNLVGVLKGHKKSVWDARFSTWDQLAVTSSADTTIKIWNLISYSCIQTLQGHLSSVLQAMFVNMGLQVCSSSSDGTVRLWDLKSSTCVTTEECGNDKIWTVTAQPDLSVIVAGSADSIITVLDDITEDKVREITVKRKKLLEDEQKLGNVMRSEKWQEAFKLAVELDRPFTLIKIIRELKQPLDDLIPIMKTLTLDLKIQLMNYTKQWNTNTKTSTEAQYMLNALLKTTKFEILQKDMPIEALIAYTQKHYNRQRTHRERVAVIQYFANKEEID